MNDMTFTQALQRLEEIVQQLERPDVELEQGLTLLEEGVKLHTFCQTTLQQTQTKITELLSKPAEGAGRAETTTGTAPTVAEPTPAQPLFTQDEGLPF